MAILRRWWALVAMVALVGLAAAAFLTWRQPRIYRSAATAIVAPTAAVNEPDSIVRSLDTLERRTLIATIARIPTAAETRASAAQSLGISRDGARAFDVTASVVPNTSIIRVQVEGRDPSQVAAMANRIMELTAGTVPRLYRIYAMEWLEQAVPSSRPVGPGAARNLAVGLLAGLFLGAAVGVLFDRRSAAYRRPTVVAAGRSIGA